MRRHSIANITTRVGRRRVSALGFERSGPEFEFRRPDFFSTHQTWKKNSRKTLQLSRAIFTPQAFNRRRREGDTHKTLWAECEDKTYDDTTYISQKLNVVTDAHNPFKQCFLFSFNEISQRIGFQLYFIIFHYEMFIYMLFNDNQFLLKFT